MREGAHIVSQPEFSESDAQDANDAAESSRVVDAAPISAPADADQAPHDSASRPATPNASDTPDIADPPAAPPIPDLPDQETAMTPAVIAEQETIMTPVAIADQETVMTPAVIADQETTLLIVPDVTDQPTVSLAVPLDAAWDAADATDAAIPAIPAANPSLAQSRAPTPAAPRPVAEPTPAPEEPPAPAKPNDAAPLFGSLLPATPGIGMSVAPSFPLPTFPRYGPASGDLTQPVPAPPPSRPAPLTGPTADADVFLGPTPLLAPGAPAAPRQAPKTRPVTTPDSRAAPKTGPVKPLPAGSRSGRLGAQFGAQSGVWLRDSRARWGVVGGVVLLVAVVVAMLWPAPRLQVNRALGVQDLPALTSRLDGDTQSASLSPANADFGQTTYPTAQAFTAYYTARDGATTLGAAITPAFTSNLGQTQFFADGALINSGAATPDSVASVASSGPGDLDTDLARDGVQDQAHGVIALPLSQALLETGSEAPIGGTASDATYATLRAAARPSDFLTPPTTTDGVRTLRRPGAPVTLLTSDDAFVIEGKLNGRRAGHTIPLAIWSYLTSAGVAPHGWWVDIGLPLTEAIPITATVDGARRQMLAQAFTQAVLTVDLGNLGPTGAPTVIPQAVGQDFLRTFGGPTAYSASGAQRWLTADGALRSTAGSATVAVGVDTNGAVRLTGESRWVDGALWYGVSWQTPARTGNAWTLAGALTATRPSAVPIYGFDVLSPSLEAYLESRGSNIGVVAYDVTRGAMYTYNPHGEFIMASSAKVPLLISYLESIEAQGRGPNDFEVATMTAMIEHSDNNAAEVIYDTLGYDAGQDTYMASWGITDYQSNPAGWGWAQWSPDDMAHLLYLLQSGKVLNASDRTFALYLMNNIEPDQQFGVGDSAPSGATFWMKNGWVTGPDNTWNVNSSGIVTVGSETYIVTVYNGELDPNSGYSDGVSIVDQVCGSIGQALK